MPTYRIQGGVPVTGEIKCLGAKNFTTKAMVASLLTREPVTLTNVPPIGDVEITAELIRSVGVSVAEKDDELMIDASADLKTEVPQPDSGANRIPVLMMSVLLHRSGEAFVPFVGGCNIGPRPLDFHFSAMEKFGADVEVTGAGYSAKCAHRLTAAHFELPYPSVGATETCLFLSVLASGTSVIRNVANEPEIKALVSMLNLMGAQIRFTDDRSIVVEGVEELFGTQYEVIGDRIEAASWACLAAATNGSITVDGIQPENLSTFLTAFNAVGGGAELMAPRKIRFFRRKDDLQCYTLETDVYPGFSTDWQQPFAILLTQAHGVSIIHETVYESRFGYLDALKEMGAVVQVERRCLGGLECRFSSMDHPHSAIIVGPSKLDAENFELTIPDLRAGLAYVMAACLNSGTTTLHHVEMIERGYGDLTDRCRDTNLKIEKVPD